MMMNLDKEAAVEVTISVPHIDSAMYELYRLQPGPGGEASHQVRLNGAVLQLEEGAIPQMPSHLVPAGTLELGPLDIVFAVVSGVDAEACK